MVHSGKYTGGPHKSRVLLLRRLRSTSFLDDSLLTTYLHLYSRAVSRLKKASYHRVNTR